VNVLDLIDQLDELLHKAKPVPLTNQARVDREEAYELLDRLRVALVEEIRRGDPTVDDE